MPLQSVFNELFTENNVIYQGARKTPGNLYWPPKITEREPEGEKCSDDKRQVIHTSNQDTERLSNINSFVLKKEGHGV